MRAIWAYFQGWFGVSLSESTSIILSTCGSVHSWDKLDATKMPDFFLSTFTLFMNFHSISRPTINILKPHQKRKYTKYIFIHGLIFFSISYLPFLLECFLSPPPNKNNNTQLLSCSVFHLPLSSHTLMFSAPALAQPLRTLQSQPACC